MRHKTSLILPELIFQIVSFKGKLGKKILLGNIHLTLNKISSNGGDFLPRKNKTCTFVLKYLLFTTLKYQKFYERCNLLEEIFPTKPTRVL